MAARTGSHEPFEGRACTWKEQSGRRIDQERARGTNAQHDGKIRLPIPDSRAEQGSDEAIGLIVQRPWPDSTT